MRAGFADPHPPNRADHYHHGANSCAANGTSTINFPPSALPLQLGLAKALASQDPEPRFPANVVPE